MKNTFFVVSLIVLLVACQKFALPDKNGDSSSHDEDESHEKGKNCMDCHYSAGYAEGVFTLAGSASGNTNNADVQLFETQGGSAIRTIQVDRLGNFYTPNDIDFSNGLYVGVRNSNGELEMMEDEIFHGQCNLCHGTSIEETLTIE